MSDCMRGGRLAYERPDAGERDRARPAPGMARRADGAGRRDPDVMRGRLVFSDGSELPLSYYRYGREVERFEMDGVAYLPAGAAGGRAGRDGAGTAGTPALAARLREGAARFEGYQAGEISDLMREAADAVDALGRGSGGVREDALVRALEDVLRRSGDTVWVGEGETLVDRMVRLGVYGHEVYGGARPWEETRAGRKRRR